MMITFLHEATREPEQIKDKNNKFVCLCFQTNNNSSTDYSLFSVVHFVGHMFNVKNFSAHYNTAILALNAADKPQQVTNLSNLFISVCIYLASQVKESLLEPEITQ